MGLGYRVKMHGKLVIKFNEVIMEMLPEIKNLLGEYYKINVVTNKGQAVIVATQKQDLYLYDKFQYEVLEKPMESETFSLELDIKEQLAKWISYRLMDVGVIY